MLLLRGAVAGNYNDYSPLVAKQRELPDLPEKFSGYHRQRHRRFTRRHQRPGYLQQLGVDAIWLTPFYISPQVDNGYDVANYTAIDRPMARWMILTSWWRSRKRAIFVSSWIGCLNHTSTQHAWFREALNKESPYRQFYICAMARRMSTRTTGITRATVLFTPFRA
ncbi:Trehalose-6-phosphate hydrolase [Salmonella enterica subsp. arizonae]|uniref:Trehalose-6-phosphate hydrolase n=1 Tax=Salmonella enterica subsp. arizonae TaxID=59203 RepID=A0A2X4WL55_SALER|nr:Trehalose-6-phosphate hydrolase [Salmonella enterica subsp. arizonae]